MVRTRADDLLLGEWACLALLAQQPAHGYDIATRLAPAGDIGRVWSLSRPLTYRALDQLTQRGLIVPVAEEKGKAGGNRTILAATPQGRRHVRRWLEEPVPHFRAVRDELLLKLVLAQLLGVDRMKLLQSQRAVFAPMVDALATSGGSRTSTSDPVAVWRYESSRSALRFIDRMIAASRHRAQTG